MTFLADGVARTPGQPEAAAERELPKQSANPSPKTKLFVFEMGPNGLVPSLDSS